jgi:hypothetical protein
VSAWRVGVEAAQVSPTMAPRAAPGVAADEMGGSGPPGGKIAGAGGAVAKDDGSGVLSSAVDRVTKWIPGDAIALYVAAVTAFSASTNAKPSVPLLIVFVVITAALVVLAEFATTGDIPKKSLLAAGLAAGAFVIWSLTVPFSGWQRLEWVHDNQAAVAVIAAVLALLFGFVAEGISKRAAKA